MAKASIVKKYSLSASGILDINEKGVFLENTETGEMIDFETVQLMMQSEYVTIAGNTIRVNYKEVTSDGIVRFKGERI